jgi:hypothetical protein
MADRVVTVGDDLTLPAVVLVPASRISDSTAAGRAVLTAADTSAQRTALGLGTAATTAATAYATAAQGTDARTPTAHSQAASTISDSTATGRSVLTAADADAARTAIGAGTSSLVIGTGAGTALDAAAAAATYAQVIGLGVSNATDDTTALNARLATAGGKTAKGMHGQSYKISGPLVVMSGSVLDMTGCTITLLAGSNTNMLVNGAMATTRSVKDFVTTAASAVVTSATAAFTAGDAGKPISIYGAGPSGGRLDTTILSYQSATQVTLNTTASIALTTGGSIGPRDSNIRITGGTWVRASGNNTPGGSGVGQAQNLNSICLRHIDGLRVERYSYASTDGKYGVSVGDVTDYVIEDGIYAAASDGVHVDGWSYRGGIRRICGATGDDLIGVTGNPGSPYVATSDTCGDIEDLVIEDCKITAQTAVGNAVSIVGDPDATTYATRRVTINRCGDMFNAAQRSVMLSNGLTDTTLNDCFGHVTVNTLNGGLTTRVFTGLRINGQRLTYRTGTTTEAILTLNTTIAGMLVDGVTINGSTGTAKVCPITIGPGTVFNSVVVRNVELDISNGSIVYIYGAATVGRSVTIDACYRDGQDYSTGRIFSMDTDAVLTELRITNTSARRCQWCVSAAMTGTLNVQVANSKFDGVFDLRPVTGQFKVKGASNMWSGNGLTSVTGGTVSSSGDFWCDVSTLAKVVGDTAVNSNNANTGTLGVGPVICYSTSTPGWKSLVSGNTF